ncbi:MAG: GAP family protein [Chloroflexota bacterium]
MTSVLLQTLAVAALGLLAPVSITLVILLLMSGREGRNGIAFMVGYISTYTLLGVVLLVLDVKVARLRSVENSSLTSFVLIGGAILCLIFAVRSWLQKPGTGTNPNRPSGFDRLIDGVTPIGAFGIAALASFVNLKNLAIFVAAVAVLLKSNLNLGIQLLMLIPLVFVFCTCVMIPVAIYRLYPEQSEDYLTRIEDIISRYSRPLGIGLTFLLSLFLFYRGVSGLL